MSTRAASTVQPPGGRPLRARLLTLGRQTFVYGIAGAASQAVGIVTLPVFARTFSPAQYGVLEIATVGYAALLVLADTGLTSGARAATTTMTTTRKRSGARRCSRDSWPR